MIGVGTFAMPSLGADMDSGRLVQWLVAPGDEVHRGDIIAVVDTAKSAIEVEVFEDGRIGQLLVEPGTEVPVGTPLAVIEATDAAAPAAAATSSPEPERRHPDPAEPSVAELARIAPPPVRHLAHQLGIDVAGLLGTGPGGRVTRQDVERAAGRAAAQQPRTQPPPAEASGPAPEPATRRRITPRARRLAAERGIDLAAVSPGATTVTGDDIPADQPTAAVLPAAAPPPSAAPPAAPASADRRQAMRQATAALMGRAAREIPHYYVSTTIDCSPMLGWLTAHNAGLPVAERVLPVAVVLRAVAVAAAAVPALNGHWVDGGFLPGDGVHIGVATATRGGGLVTPALRSAQELGTDALMARLTDLVRRARRGTLRSSEIAPGTITVSSLADGGPDALFGVIYPPQVALVGVGAIAPRPWAVDGMLAVRPTVTITLAADHRATDGATGAAFLQALAAALAHPEEL